MDAVINYIKENIWLILAAAAGIAFFVYIIIQKFKPLISIMNENKEMERKYSILSEDQLNDFDDDELIKAVMFNIWSRMEDDMSDEYEIIKDVNEYQRAVYVAKKLDKDINDGGFEQIYLTQSRKLSQFAYDAFKAIGAEKYADMIEKANKIYAEHKEIFDAGKRLKQDDQFLFYEIEKDLPSAMADENIRSLCIQYIRNNVQEFTGGNPKHPVENKKRK